VTTPESPAGATFASELPTSTSDDLPAAPVGSSPTPEQPTRGTDPGREELSTHPAEATPPDEPTPAEESTRPTNESTKNDTPVESQTGLATDNEASATENEAVEATASDLPPLTDDTDLASALEALLLVVDTPAGEELLATALDQPVARVTDALHRMSADLTDRGSGIDLRRIGDGWRFVTRDRHAPFVEKLLLDGQRAKLTRAALETLAVIAYRQPVTRSRVAAVRGVNVDGVIRTLVARGLIGETGTDSETGGILYRTTELFLERLGLSSLEDLPPIAPLLPEVDTIDDV